MQFQTWDFVGRGFSIEKYSVSFSLTICSEIFHGIFCRRQEMTVYCCSFSVLTNVLHCSSAAWAQFVASTISLALFTALSCFVLISASLFIISSRLLSATSFSACLVSFCWLHSSRSRYCFASHGVSYADKNETKDTRYVNYVSTQMNCDYKKIRVIGPWLNEKISSLMKQKRNRPQKWNMEHVLWTL